MPYFEIPTGPSPRTLSVPLNGVVYGIRFAFADTDEGGWFMDISDASGNSLVAGIPLVTGADLIAQYAYLGIGGKLWVATDSDPGAVPTFAGLGSSSHLYFETN